MENQNVIPRWGKLYKENPQTPCGINTFYKHIGEIGNYCVIPRGGSFTKKIPKTPQREFLFICPLSLLMPKHGNAQGQIKNPAEAGLGDFLRSEIGN